MKTHKHIQEAIHKLSHPTSTKELKFVVNHFSLTRTPTLDGFTTNIFKNLLEKYYQLGTQFHSVRPTFP